MWCAGRLYARQERDRHHTGRVDTWEFFDGGVLREARYDDNNDGQPERWEMFRYGRLFQIKRDTNLDGEPDQEEDVPRESAGDRESALTCDGSEPPPVPDEPRPQSPTSGGESPDAGGEEGGEGGEGTGDDTPETTPGEGMPWEGVSDVPPEEAADGGEGETSEETE